MDKEQKKVTNLRNVIMKKKSNNSDSNDTSRYNFKNTIMKEKSDNSDSNNASHYNNLKNLILKKKWIIILSFTILLAFIILSIYFLNRVNKVEIVTREKSDIKATTDIQNLEILNVFSEKNEDKQQTTTLYILIKNVANSEQFLGDIQIELQDDNHVTKNIINGYIPEIGANSNYEIKTTTNIDLSRHYKYTYCKKIREVSLSYFLFHILCICNLF